MNKCTGKFIKYFSFSAYEANEVMWAAGICAVSNLFFRYILV